ncbi:MAG: hypothetical protein B6241_13265 [Spirochaetaceae bacterium 4572_59]|nr:MAG: hypothetical protein B6241_13265 [Spirochaetaceae bacterium 4572_59]
MSQSDSYYRQILAILRCIILGREVWLYGSRANGSSYEASDVDLVSFPEERGNDEPLRTGRGDELDLQLQLKAAFQESHIPLFVDILSWMVIPESFHQS